MPALSHTFHELQFELVHRLLSSIPILCRARLPQFTFQPLQTVLRLLPPTRLPRPREHEPFYLLRKLTDVVPGGSRRGVPCRRCEFLHSSHVHHQHPMIREGSGCALGDVPRIYSLRVGGEDMVPHASRPRFAKIDPFPIPVPSH